MCAPFCFLYIDNFSSLSIQQKSIEQRSIKLLDGGNPIIMKLSISSLHLVLDDWWLSCSTGRSAYFLEAGIFLFNKSDVLHDVHEQHIGSPYELHVGNLLSFVSWIQEGSPFFTDTMQGKDSLQELTVFLQKNSEYNQPGLAFHWGHWGHGPLLSVPWPWCFSTMLNATRRNKCKKVVVSCCPRQRTEEPECLWNACMRLGLKMFQWTHTLYSGKSGLVPTTELFVFQFRLFLFNLPVDFVHVRAL